MTERFSAREGHRPAAAPITIREEAPPELRGAILVLAQEAGMSPSPMRDLICQVLLVKPDSTLASVSTVPLLRPTSLGA